MPDLRMPDINNVFLAGRLTRDPEVSESSGGTLCKMSVAYSRGYKAKDGTPKEEVLFIDVTAWRKTAEYCGEKLRKGHPIYVYGSLKMDSWEAKDGTKRTKITITASRVQALAWDEDRPEPDQRQPDEVPF
jgi:single-strand DNA-binding protein